MTYPNLSAEQDPHAFLAEYLNKHPDDVVVVDESVSADETITGLIYELATRGRHDMVFCRRVGDAGVPVLSNVFASRERVARLLGTEPARIHETYQLLAAHACAPRTVETGPILEVVRSAEQVDLCQLPLLRHFASDKAPYVTSGIVVAEDPASGGGNMSYHRAMIHSATEMTTSLHSRGDLWRMLQLASGRGEQLPVAMVIGGHPLFMLAASARVPYSVDERAIAGGLFGQPLDVVQTPKYGIRVPAWADFVLEGTIDPDAHADEGPFGEFSGYSSDRSTRNILHVDTMLSRREPLLIDVEGGNTDDHLNLARIPRESEMAQKLKERFPDVTAIHYPTSGTHFHCYVAMRQRRAGQARQVMLGLLGWDPYLKTVIAVDEDVDVSKDSEVLWALATHFQPQQDLFIVDGLPGSPLDPSSTPDGTTSRMGLDATRGPHFEGRRIEISAEAFDQARMLLDGSTEGSGDVPG